MGNSALRVLLVDDDIGTTVALSILLEMQGHETAAVHDGLKVISALSEGVASHLCEFDAFLQKPFDADKLLGTTRRLLRSQQ